MVLLMLASGVHGKVKVSSEVFYVGRISLWLLALFGLSEFI